LPLDSRNCMQAVGGVSALHASGVVLRVAGFFATLAPVGRCYHIMPVRACQSGAVYSSGAPAAVFCMLLLQYIQNVASQVVLRIIVWPPTGCPGCCCFGVSSLQQQFAAHGIQHMAQWWVHWQRMRHGTNRSWPPCHLVCVDAMRVGSTTA
jgi:hypothetical protein